MSVSYLKDYRQSTSPINTNLNLSRSQLKPTDKEDSRELRDNRDNRDKRDKRDILLLHPDNISQGFIVKDRLNENLNKYVDDGSGNMKWTTIYKVPLYLHNSIEILQSRIRVRNRKPGLNPVISCCVDGGIEAIKESESVQDLLRLRSLLLSLSIDGDFLDCLRSWFDNFPLDMRTGFGVNKNLNINIPDYLLSAASDIAKKLGLQSGIILSLSIMSTLLDQEEIDNPQHRQRMSNCLDDFYAIAAKRVRISNKLCLSLAELNNETDDSIGN